MAVDLVLFLGDPKLIVAFHLRACLKLSKNLTHVAMVNHSPFEIGHILQFGDLPLVMVIVP